MLGLPDTFVGRRFAPMLMLGSVFLDGALVPERFFISNPFK